MLKNYIIFAFRSIKRNGLYSAINCFGLSVSLVFCLVIAIYIDGSLRWDTMHPNHENTYLLSVQLYLEDDVETDEFSIWDFSDKPIRSYGAISYKHAQEVREANPKITQSVLLFNSGVGPNARPTDMVYPDRSIGQTSIASFDGPFFDFFHTKTLLGNPTGIYDNPRAVVVSKDFAERYFGSVDAALNEEVNFILNDKEERFYVQAVVEVPDKSSIDFNVLMNMQANTGISNSLFDLESNVSFTLFIGLTPGSDINEVEADLNAFFSERFADYLTSKRRFSELREDSPYIELKGTNIAELHLNTLINWSGRGNPEQLMYTGLFGVVLLIIALLNYFLITLATITRRAKNVSIVRVTGATRKNIHTQFWIENSIISLLSLVLAICLTQIVLPFVGDFLGVSMVWNTASLIKSGSIALLLMFISSLLLSAYPSQVLSRLKLSDSLKGNTTYKSKGTLLDSLVTIQFVICFIFIALGIVMNSQIRFMLSKDMGFDKEQVVYVSTGDPLLKQELEKYPEFSHVGQGGGWLFGNGEMSFLEKIKGEDYSITQMEAEPELLELFDLKIQWLDTDFGDAPAAIINGELADMYGRDSLHLVEIGFNQKVVGIVENVNLQPFTEQEELFFINPNSQQRRIWQTFIKIQPGQLKAGLDRLEQVWSQVYPNKFLRYTFIDDELETSYQSYQTTIRLINLITVLGVVICCLGLFALNGISINNRLKEIGIRKVLGASVDHIMILVNKRTLIVFFVALSLALPVSGYILNKWLSSFSVQTDQIWLKLLMAGLIGFFIMVITVSSQTFKSSRINPTQLLRNE